MITSSGDNKAKSFAATVSRKLRIETFLRNETKTSISRKLGVSRTTLTHRLKQEDPTLSTFIGVSQAIDADPVELLQSALVDEGVE